jgi:hypothetical protein
MANKYRWDGVEKPTLEQRWNNNHSLGEKIEIMFTRFVQKAFLWCIDFISDRLVDVFDNSMKILQPGMERMMSPVMQNLLNNPGIPEDVKASIRAVQNEKGESGFIGKLAVWIYTIRAGIFGGLGPVQRFAEYNADKTMRSFLPDISSLGFMRHIGLMSEEGFQNSMAQLGVHDKLIPLYIELAKRFPNTGEIIAGLWRGTINEGDFTALLKRQGYDEKSISLYKELSKQLPPLSDLIHMLVRDAFNDSAANQYGYDEDFPQEINEFFEKQGYEASWAKRYWRSHWNLPSPNQAYEMLHRGLIEQGDLETLLRISDYPKFWRDKLKDISYNVMTRVDVRRLLQSGLMDEAKALDTYKKMGYTPDDAELLTQFAMQGISQDEKDLTKTDVLNLYEEGLLDRNTTADNLVKMGYDSTEAEEILKLSDIAIAKATRSDLVNFTKEKFLAKKITENDARSELAQIGLKSQSVDRYLLNWNRATEVESAIPSIADIKKWYALDYIDETKFRAYLTQHRHTEENISLYVRQLNDQKAEQATNEQA